MIAIALTLLLGAPPVPAPEEGVRVKHYHIKTVEKIVPELLTICEAPRTFLEPNDGLWHPGEIDPIGTHCNCAMCRRNRLSAKPYKHGEYDPTPMDGVLFLLECADLDKNDVLYDLGCGDGRILIAAARLYKARCVGI